MTLSTLVPTTFQPDIDPVGDSLAISALVALVPLLTVFVTLGLLRWKAHWAGLTAVAVAIVVAVLFFGMPVELAVLAATQGAAFGVFPIMWIVFTAIVLYQVTVRSGRFEDLRATFHLISDDPRVQAIIIAFCFGGLLEALAGFGAPVAITGVMLMALGFSPLRAAAVVLLANTAPVAFGAIGTPIITAGALTGIPYTEIGAYVGHQTPILAAFVPLLLVLMADGRRGVRQTWPVAVVVGVTFAFFQWLSATFISVELTDIIASLAGLAAAVLFLRSGSPPDASRRSRRSTSSASATWSRWRRAQACCRTASTASTFDQPGRGSDGTWRRGPWRAATTTPSRPTSSTSARPVAHPGPDQHGALPLPARHRRLLARQARAAGQGLAGQHRPQDRVAGPRRRGADPRRQAEPLDDLHPRLAQLPRHPAADLRAHRRPRLRHRPQRVGARRWRRPPTRCGSPSSPSPRCWRWPTS